MSDCPTWIERDGSWVKEREPIMVIVAGEGDLWWNDELDGWVGDLDQATKFTAEQSLTLDLPEGENPRWDAY